MVSEPAEDGRAALDDCREPGWPTLHLHPAGNGHSPSTLAMVVRFTQPLPRGIRQPGPPAAIPLACDRHAAGVPRCCTRPLRARSGAEVGDFVIPSRRQSVRLSTGGSWWTTRPRGSPNHCAAAVAGFHPATGYLQTLLGLPTPTYAHLPVAVDRRGLNSANKPGSAARSSTNRDWPSWPRCVFLGKTHLSNWAGATGDNSGWAYAWRLELNLPSIPARCTGTLSARFREPRAG